MDGHRPARQDDHAEPRQRRERPAEEALQGLLSAAAVRHPLEHQVDECHQRDEDDQHRNDVDEELRAVEPAALRDIGNRAEHYAVVTALGRYGKISITVTRGRVGP